MTDTIEGGRHSVGPGAAGTRRAAEPGTGPRAGAGPGSWLGMGSCLRAGRSRRAWLLGGLAAASAGWAGAAQAASCADLGGLQLPNVALTATAEPAGSSLDSGFGSPIVVPQAFCRVQAVLTPVPGSRIMMEVWLPARKAWSGRFEGTGNGGLSGSIYGTLLAEGLARGDAVANSDQGHEPAAGVSEAAAGADGSFITGDPQSFIDFGYRATHLMTSVGKQVATAFYGRAPDHSYFAGCSSGGRQALKEAQKFPDDYDGILAGDPANDWVNLNFDQAYEVLANTLNPAGTIPPAKFPLIASAVLAKCGGQDGSAQPFVNNPLACRFNPAVLACPAGTADAATCLTPAQVDTVRAVYAGPTDQRTGLSLFPGFEPGSETLWGALSPTGQPGGFAIADSYLKYFVFQNPAFDYTTLNFGSDVTRAELQDHGVVGALDADLGPFRANGGKMIQYHGWSDTTVAPGSSVDYYRRVALGPVAGNALLRQVDAITITSTVPTSDFRPVQSYYRLFMVPGMGHCYGGAGPDSFGAPFQANGTQDPSTDVLAALERWVEHGVAPAQVTATKYVNDDPTQGVAFTRPLCAYPQVAKYSGSGATTDAASFRCE